jgi:hypothetical protein
MHEFESWVNFLADHASDADDRKDIDPDESPRHYIDIDNYPAFVYSGRIPQTLDSVVNYYGHAFVYDQGILPWATKTTFDSLQNCLQRGNFEKAKIFAADLGHYVGDGYMPLHITRNYNGQYTGNDGIHSRYESTIINAYVNQINYTGDSVEVIDDVNQYIFNYLYANYLYVDSVLMADNYAKSFGSTNSQAYKQALWNKTGLFTTRLFKQASHTLTELIYTAWVNAGSPSLTSFSIGETNRESASLLHQNVPNPFRGSTRICYDLRENSKVILQIKNSSGKIVSTLTNEQQSAGSYTIDWTAQDLPGGVYYLILNTGKTVEARKLVHLE